MYKLKSIYGKRAFDFWDEAEERMRRGEPPRFPSDLRGKQQSSAQANDDVWTVCSYPKLVQCISFLTVMNKRLILLYRGQAEDRDLLPAIFRCEWPMPPHGRLVKIDADRRHLWQRLDELGDIVYTICQKRGLPRWRTLNHVREAKWAVTQHYGLWPTPLIDLTSSLRVAASFALKARAKGDTAVITGFLYVVGMPNLTGSVTHSLDDQLVLARLNAVCPPAAMRPHLQDGFLVGRFPFYDIDSTKVDENNLGRRLIAKFKLIDNGEGEFWNEDFPRISDEALLPSRDALLEDFRSRISYDDRSGRVLPGYHDA